MAGRTLPPGIVMDLRSVYDIAPDHWQAALVGKDGTVKRTWKEPFAPGEAFEMIDAMPMRIREASEGQLDG
jgi:hypothetical protein